MSTALSGTARAIYAICFSAALVLDAVLFILLLLNGMRTDHFGIFVAYVLFGTWIIPTVGHWIGMLISAPFQIADAATKKRSVTQPTSEVRSSDLREIAVITAPGKELVAFGYVSGVLPSQVWDGIFYLRTDLFNPMIRFQQKEVLNEHGVLEMQPPSWSSEVDGPSIDQLMPIKSVDWVRVDSRLEAEQEPLVAHKEILSHSRDANVLTGHATVDGEDRFFVFVGNEGTPFTPVDTWELAFRQLGVKVIE